MENPSSEYPATVLKFCNNVNSKILKSYKEHNIQSIYEVNVLDYNGLIEVQTSDLIKLVFSYEKDGSYPIWKSFVNNFFSKELAESIKRPVFTSEQQHIDVCVKEKGKYVFIIENKLKDADFQRNQLGRYIKKMQLEKYDPEKIYLIIIPGHIDNNYIERIRKSAWKAPADWKETNSKRKCSLSDSSDKNACRCDSKNWSSDEWCKKCSDCKELLENLEKQIKIIDVQFPEWIIEIINDQSCIPQEEYLLRSAMLQFAHYIKGIYQIRLNKKQIMENINVLINELKLNPENPEESYRIVKKTLGDINKLQESMSNLLVMLKIRIWQKEIENLFPDARVDSNEESFGILIKDIYCGIWIGSKGDPYWGFYQDANKIKSQEANNIVNNIIKKTSYKSKGTGKGFLAWDYTEKGIEIINNFLIAAEELGYNYKRKQ